MPSSRKSTVTVQDAMINWFVSKFDLPMDDVVMGLNDKHDIIGVDGTNEIVDGFLMQKSMFNINNKACSFSSIQKATIVVKCNHFIQGASKCKATVVKSGDRSFCHNHQPSVLLKKETEKKAKNAEKEAKKMSKKLKKLKSKPTEVDDKPAEE